MITAVPTIQGPSKMDEGNDLGAVRRQDGDSWVQASWPPSFPTGRVDIWRLRLDEPSKADSAIVLSPDEMARANRFHFEKDRIRFTRCRSTLRILIAGYLSVSAAEIVFQYSTSGKPGVITEQNSRALQFNVSHSGNFALIAVGCEHRVGVDVEKIRTDADTTALAERYFSIRERAGLRTLPEPLRVSAFFACWTRKESFLKATGDGLSFPLANFSVTTDPDSNPEIEEINGKADAAKQWRLADLKVAAGYRAALAIDGFDSRVETFAWN